MVLVRVALSHRGWGTGRGEIISGARDALGAAWARSEVSQRHIWHLRCWGEARAAQEGRRWPAAGPRALKRSVCMLCKACGGLLYGNLAGPSSNPAHIVQGEVPPNQARPPRGELDSPQSPGMGEDVLLGLISGVCDASLGAMAIRLVGVAMSKELVYRTLRISDRINHERRNEGKRGRKATDLV